MRTRLIVAFVGLLLLAGCGSSTGSQNNVVSGPAQSGRSATATQPAGTATPTTAPTRAETPTVAPTAVPTAAQATSAPTAAQPTAQPTTQPPADPGAGSSVIYVQRGGELVGVDPGTGQLRQTGLEAPEQFSISPDGRWAALLDNNGGLTLARLDGSETRQVADDVLGQMDWTADSSALAFVQGRQVQITYPTLCGSGNSIVVYEVADSSTRTVGNGCNPDWDPRGRRIAYVSPADITGRTENALYLTNRFGENTWTPLNGRLSGSDFPETRASFFAPFWSLDGNNIFVLTLFSQYAETNWHTIEQVNATQGGAKPIAVLADVSGLTVVPSPDRRRVVFASAGAKGTTSIVATNLQGQPYTWSPQWLDGEATLQDKELASVEHAYNADWSPNGEQLAVLYCLNASDPIGLCSPESALELRMMNPQTGALSEPLADGIDPQSGIQWRP